MSALSNVATPPAPAAYAKSPLRHLTLLLPAAVNQVRNGYEYVRELSSLAPRELISATAHHFHHHYHRRQPLIINNSTIYAGEFCIYQSRSTKATKQLHRPTLHARRGALTSSCLILCLGPVFKYNISEEAKGDENLRLSLCSCYCHCSFKNARTRGRAVVKGVLTAPV